MASDQQIVVRGEAERQAPADIAALTVVVQVDDTDQAAAFAGASELAGKIDAVLDARASSLGPRQAAVVVVQPTVRWTDGGEERTGWRAVRSTSLDVTALDQLSPLLAELVGAGAIVHGPFWRLRADHPVFAEVREAAAVDARSRGESYVSALGLRLGRVEWVSEPGLRTAAPFAMTVPTAMSGYSKLRAGGAEDTVAMQVNPAELTITAAVEVGFGIKRG